MNCSAVMPLYLTNPITAKGEAPIMHSQLVVSIPNLPRSRKNKPTATPQAATENKN